jgi:hypothetical protein
MLDNASTGGSPALANTTPPSTAIVRRVTVNQYARSAGRAATGHATAALPMSTMKLRRFMRKMLVEHKAYQRTASCVAAKCGC